ncbi:MAG: hypothetical protein J0L82_08270 [Deltaproteobacteria bacterium]|nr:hypothetical protein [Deltaproteobacteria bacterium]
MTMRLTRWVLNSCAALSTMGTFAGCSSSDDMRLSTVPEHIGKNARAHPAAYGVTDSFNFGKPQKVRPANDFLFYFKECESSDPEGDRAYFSKTAYSCSGAR